MMVEMHRERATLREIGNDPAAYKERLAGDLLKDPTFLAKALEAGARASAARNRGQPRTRTTETRNLAICLEHGLGRNDRSGNRRRIRRRQVRPPRHWQTVSIVASGAT